MRKQFIDWWRAVLYWNCPSVTNSELFSVQNSIVNNLSGHKEIFGSLTSRKLDIKARWHWKPIIELTKYCILITKLVFELNISVTLHTKFHRFLELPKGSFRKLPLGSSKSVKFSGKLVFSYQPSYSITHDIQMHDISGDGDPYLN